VVPGAYLNCASIPFVGKLRGCALSGQGGDIMFGRIGLPEILVIVLVIVVFFGMKNLPEIVKGLGEGLRLFKKELKKPDEENKSNA